MPHRYGFSTKGVLRHIKWTLTKEYCAANQLFPDLPCLQQDERDVDALCEAIEGLPASLRTDVEQDLQDVYLLADEEGMRMIYEEARFRGDDLPALLADVDGPHDTAMWALLNREDLFAELLRFCSADRLTRRFWHIRRGVSNGEPRVNRAARDRLSQALTDYLVPREGRGHRCHIDYLRRSTGHLYIAYPEDFPATLFEYDDADELARRKIRPTTDLLFFYSPESGKLEIFSQGGKQKIQDLQALFAQTILGIGLAPDRGEGKVYDLNLLKRTDFSFLIDPASGLESIDVKWTHLRDRDGGQGLTLEVNGPPGRGVTHVAERYFAIDSSQPTDKYAFSLMDIDRAYLQAHFRPLGRKRRGRARSFPLTPTGCLLDQEGIDGIIRKVLIDSGVERTAPDLVAA